MFERSSPVAVWAKISSVPSAELALASLSMLRFDGALRLPSASVLL